jgi:hypothetical protein
MTACTVCGAELVHAPSGAWVHEGGFPEAWLDHPATAPSAPPGWSCSCGFTAPETLARFSAEWHRQHRACHLEAFPELDDRSRSNLDAIVDWAVRHEASPSTLHLDLPKD